MIVMKHFEITAVILLAVATPAAHAQSTIDPAARFAYGADAGWINFSPSAAHGAHVTETYLAGNAYAANLGWINLGDGTPTNGYRYANTAGDFGVTVAGDGALGGFAYGANVGWINFGWAQPGDPNAPYLDFLTGQFSGFAYGANVGWIALERPGNALATATLACPDTDTDGIGDAWERLYFGNLSAAGIGTDTDGNAVSDAAEYLANTDPEDASDYLRVLHQDYDSVQTQVTIEFTSNPARLYHIETTTDLQDSWQDSGLGVISPDPGSTTTRTLAFATGARRFFRAVARKPLQP
jgi:hypothetical protein